MATESAAGEARCVVCQKPVSEAMSAVCNWCGGRYHLNQRNDVEAQDCGNVWIDEQHLALQFACATCLGTDPAMEIQPSPRKVPSTARVRRYKRRA